jgi:hypothetical protein
MWSVAGCVAALVAFTVLSPESRAETPPCAISSITANAKAIYPPIARQAPITGRAIFLVAFNTDGFVQQITTVHAQPMLAKAATSYLEGLQANPYTGPRVCPIVIDFRVVDSKPCVNDDPRTEAKFIDHQHIEITTQAVWLCDPTSEVSKRRRRFLIF